MLKVGILSQGVFEMSHEDEISFIRVAMGFEYVPALSPKSFSTDLFGQLERFWGSICDGFLPVPVLSSRIMQDAGGM